MKIVIMGAGISGHTAALTLQRNLKKGHEVIVVSPNSKWNWIPSNIWVGVGDMTAEDVTFELAPVYKKTGITFVQAKAFEVYPEGSSEKSKPYIKVESTQKETKGQIIDIEYDYLINATGPRLNFGATPGLGPDGHTVSVCTVDHALHASKELTACVERMRKGEKLKFVIGTGHGMCTCEGAAFEYVLNLEFELRRQNVRENAQLIFFTNEAELGDFGVGGLHLENMGFLTPSKIFTESLFKERGIDWVLGAHPQKIEKNKITYEDLSGEVFELAFDFAMLLPPFTGSAFKAFNQKNEDITSTLFAPSGFMKVDGNYTPKPYEEWQASDWPKTYQTLYKNVFAVGIAFAPPHQISKPQKNKNGTMIAPAPPRTGMPSAIMGRAVAMSIIDMIKNNSQTPTQEASMAVLGAACVASTGANAFTGGAVSMTMFPIVPDYKKYPKSGRSLIYTTGEIGAAGHWIKKLLHYAFIYKAKANPFWWIIPE